MEIEPKDEGAPDDLDPDIRKEWVAYYENKFPEHLGSRPTQDGFLAQVWPPTKEDYKGMAIPDYMRAEADRLDTIWPGKE